jgi:cyclophilin family peptidyl-prolyl cis-trans isomerase
MKEESMPRKVINKPTRKQVTRKVSVRQPVIETEPVMTPEPAFAPFVGEQKKQNMMSFWIGTAIVILVILGILAYKNGRIVVATVNGQPIFSWQLTNELMNRYGKQTAEGMITEKMIEIEAAKEGVTIAQKDIDDRESEMMKEFGDQVNLDDVLKMQGLTKKDFDKQVSIQLAVEKLLTKGFTVTDEDVTNYLATNSAMFTATDEATLKADVRKTIMNEFIAKTFQTWFTGLILIGGIVYMESTNRNVPVGTGLTSAPKETQTPTASESGALQPPPTTKPMKQQTYPTQPTMVIDTKKTYSATLTTSAGTMKLRLNASEAPITVNNFVFLAREGFYTGTVFHRVLSGFMIQGGDPTGTGTGSPGYRFDDEVVTRDYTRGTIAMANSGPNTNGSQFFIMHADYALPKQYVIFGSIDPTDTESMKTLDALASTPVVDNGMGEKSKPVTPPTITAIMIEER